MQQQCILCGRSCEEPTTRPGTPVLCQLHVWKNLRPWETFTREEAYREGCKRVSSLSPSEIKQEGLMAYSEVEKWEQELSNPKVRGNLRQYYLTVITMKRSYLSSFEKEGQYE